MAKLKNIIQQLSVSNYSKIYENLSESGAEKSAYLLKTMRERSISDYALMNEINVNANAYYTLRSRLNQKIEEYLLQQIESPRTDLIKKAASINEIMFTQKPTIAITTLKKLEKELIDYDLSAELTNVYKALKKLYVNTSEEFNYSQKYNQSVAYTLALDKAEDLLVQYFQKFGLYTLSGDENDRTALILLSNEMDNTCNLYQSHRLFIYRSCMKVMHRLYIENKDVMGETPIENILDEMQATLTSYSSDGTYFHLGRVHSYLRLQYYLRYNLVQKAEEHFEEINDNVPSLLSNYHYFTFSSFFLTLKVRRAIKIGDESVLYNSIQELESISSSLAKYNETQYIYVLTFFALAAHYKQKPEEAARWLNKLLNTITLKKYPFVGLEVKSLLALQYVAMHDTGLFQQTSNSIQRQIRIIGKEACVDIILFNKILKIAHSPVKRNKEEKIIALANSLYNLASHRIFNPIRLIKIDNHFIHSLLAREEEVAQSK